MGVNHSSKGTETVNAINNLALITGNIGRSGASPFSITGQCNAMGTREAGFASSHARLSQVRERRRPRGAGRHSGTFRSSGFRPRAASLIRTSSRRRSSVAIRALWIIATNPIVSFPNLGVLTQALETVEFLVVQDGFHPTPTSEFAHLVLPAAIWGEKEGTYTNSERRVSKVNAAVEPPDEARSDFDIFLDVASALGCRDELFPGWTKPEDAFEEWKRVSAGRLCDYSGMTYEADRRDGGIQWPYPAGRRDADVDPPALRRWTVSDRGRQGAADSDQWETFPEPPNDEFPFVLNTGRTVEHWHTRTKTGRARFSNGCRRGVARDEPARRPRARLKPTDAWTSCRAGASFAISSCG